MFDKFSTNELEVIAFKHGGSWKDAERAYLVFQRCKSFGLKAGFIAGFILGIWLIVFVLKINSVLGFIFFFISLGGGSTLMGGILGYVLVGIGEQVFKSTTKTGRLLRVICNASECRKSSDLIPKAKDDVESDLDRLIKMTQESGVYLMKRSRLKNDPTVIYDHYATIAKNNLTSTTLSSDVKRQSLEFIGNLASLLDNIADDHIVEMLEQQKGIAAEAEQLIESQGAHFEGGKIGDMRKILDEYIATSPKGVDLENFRKSTLNFRLQQRCADEFSSWQYLVTGKH